MSLDDFLFAINDVRPSFIRVEADEATYNMHIILRFELEQALISGDLKPADVPAAWNEKFQQLLRPDAADRRARAACRTSTGASAASAIFRRTRSATCTRPSSWSRRAHDLGDLDDDFRRGEFGRLKGWLNDSIHRHGQRWRAADLCRRVTGRDLSPQPLMKYLREKYALLYGL